MITANFKAAFADPSGKSYTPYLSYSHFRPIRLRIESDSPILKQPIHTGYLLNCDTGRTNIDTVYEYLNSLFRTSAFQRAMKNAIREIRARFYYVNRCWKYLGLEQHDYSFLITVKRDDYVTFDTILWMKILGDSIHTKYYIPIRNHLVFVEGKSVENKTTCTTCPTRMSGDERIIAASSDYVVKEDA